MFSSPFLRYDDANMLTKTSALAKDLVLAKKTLLEDWKSGAQGWMGCPEEKMLEARISKLASEKRKKFKTCLVIGIGGSDLGARAGWHALKHEAKGMRLEFLGGNTDPDEIEWTLKSLDLKTTLVNIISKSGDTLEPMATFAVLRDRLQRLVGSRYAEQVVATTDEEKGSLHALAVQESYAMLPVSNNIGGRFSVLTAVGLFPLACAGIDIKKMLAGAKQVRDEYVAGDAKKHDAARYAAHHVLGDLKEHRPIHILMPYSERLRVFGQWYRQIWAESLGKDDKGPTPIAALGATDQHSQIQDYNQGAKDKLITFIEVEHFSSKLKAPRIAADMPTIQDISNMPFERIIHAERQGTAQALTKSGRPNGTLHLSKIDSATLGGLFMFFEIVTGIAGSLYGINTYNQPGVEEGKKLMRQILKNGV